MPYARRRNARRGTRSNMRRGRRRGPPRTRYTRKKIARGVPAAVMASETKMRKDIIDLSGTNVNTAVGSFYCIPYCQHFSQLDGTSTSALNPDLVDTSVPANPMIPQNLGNFIPVGDLRSQRNGRRVTILNAYLEFVMHFRARAQTTGDPPTTTYTYPMNPEVRVVQGWVKGGIDSLHEITSDFSSLYNEINFSRYKVIKDFIVSRRAVSAIGGSTVPAEGAASYAPIKLKFKWSPNQRVTFDASPVAGAVTTEVRYTGWVPFVYFISTPAVTTDLLFDFDNVKRLLVFKDL